MENVLVSDQKKFSLFWYLVIVCLLSWPFQILSFVMQSGLYSRYVFNSLSMIMVTVGTYVYGHYIQKNNFKDAGWNFGKPIHYIAVISVALFIWLLPTIIDVVRGSISLPDTLQIWQVLTIILFFVFNLFPAFGEEFGWRGFMLPNLASRFSPRKAILIQAVIWWLWHLPILLENIYYYVVSVSMTGGLNLKTVLSILIFLLLSGLPAIGHGILVGYIWVATSSLAVVVVYHAAIDAVRDSIQITVGTGPLTSMWINVVFILIGIVLVWKGDWKRLEDFRSNNSE